jgi:hypothetical protein
LYSTSIRGGEEMKKIINGLRYDSSNAIEIGSYDNIGREASSQSDFRWWEATLYRTPRSGRYFLVGEGGAMSRFAQSAGQNSWSGGDDLIPMSKEEALEWAERYLDPEVIEVIEEHFGDLVENA